MTDMDWAKIRSRLNRAKLARLEGEIRNDVVPFRPRPQDTAARERKIQNAFDVMEGRNRWFEQKFAPTVMGTARRHPYELTSQQLAQIDALIATLPKRHA